MGRSCAVKGCRATNNLFKASAEKLDEWRQILSAYTVKVLYVCKDHFLDWEYDLVKKRLLKDAVPTLNLGFHLALTRTQQQSQGVVTATPPKVVKAEVLESFVDPSALLQQTYHVSDNQHMENRPVKVEKSESVNVIAFNAVEAMDSTDGNAGGPTDPTDSNAAGQTDSTDFNAVGPANSTDYQLLKNILEEAKVSVLKAQECALDISQNTDSASNNLSHYFTQVTRSIDQAVISTTLGLSALDSILTMSREEERPIAMETQVKQELRDENIKFKADLQDGDNTAGEGPRKIIQPGLAYPDLVHVEAEQVYNCNQCEYSTKVKRYLSYHVKSQHMPRRFKCEQCDFTANRPYEMKNHMKSRHFVFDLEYLTERENPDIKFYLCKNCSYGNTNKAELEMHIKEEQFAMATNNFLNPVEDEDIKHHIGDAEDLPQFVEEKFEPNNIGKIVLIQKVKKKGMDHLLVEGDEVLSCTRCSFTTKNKLMYDDHVNGEYNYYKCRWCDFYFEKGTRNKFGEHLKLEHGLGEKNENGQDIFKCQECPMSFATGVKLLNHSSVHHKDAPMFHCTECEYNGRTIVLLKTHMDEHNDATFQCDQCPHVAKSSGRLQKHVYNSHRLDALCDDCGSVFSTSDNLKKHQKICGKKVKNPGWDAGRRRQRSHTRVTCSNCDFSTWYLTRLKKHYAKNHKEVGSEKEIEQKCVHCDHVSYTLANYYYHYRKEHQEKTFECDECDYATSSESCYRIHKVKKHSCTRTGFPCDICGAVFTMKAVLKKHIMNKHSTDADRLCCEEAGCNYTTMQKESLKAHIDKVHLGIKWPCNLCEYMGPYKGDLNRHMKKIHNIYPEGSMMKCDLCEFTTQKATTMTVHKKKVHDVEG